MLLQVTIIILVLIALLIVERLFVKRRIKKIPIRIHVNGTRGKSSVVEYIAAGLRTTEKKVFAKITGVIPTIILPNGQKEFIIRRSPPRVQEQVKIIYKAAKYNAGALVIECMSILPELQRIERKMIDPGVYVITNILDDHQEEMGSTVDEMAEAICSAIPANAVVVTNEIKYARKIKQAAELVNSKTIFPSALEEVLFAKLPDGLFPANMELALSVCEMFGAERLNAFEAICSVYNSNPGYDKNFYVAQQNVFFVNGFAVNDIPSAETFIDHWQAKAGAGRALIIILNTRSDRPLRTISFCKWLNSVEGLNKIILCGTHKEKARRALIASGFAGENVCSWGKKEIDNIPSSLEKLINKPTLLLGLGNIAGDGFSILNSIDKHFSITKNDSIFQGEKRE